MIVKNWKEFLISYKNSRMLSSFSTILLCKFGFDKNSCRFIKQKILRSNYMRNIK